MCYLCTCFGRTKGEAKLNRWTYVLQILVHKCVTCFKKLHGCNYMDEITMKLHFTLNNGNPENLHE